jgi:hypothetical protein
LRDAGLNEFFLLVGDRAEIGGDLFLELAGDLVAAIARLHPFPKMNVVVVLSGIVEQTLVLAERPFHNLFNRLVFPFGALGQIIAVIDLGKMVLVVVVLERLARHVGREHIIGIGKFGQRE